jgi:PKD repeat protein
MKRLLYLFMIMVCCLFACIEVPSQFGVDLNVETSSELGPDTLARIDAVNQTLATGLEVGPETRQVIRELNQTIRQGVKTGFDEATLARVDDLLRVVEDGLKIGLDEETLDTINGIVDAMDRMPGNWEIAASEIVRTLERSGGTLAGRMADEVKAVMNEARLNMQQMTAIAGTEFRCNVDFLGSKAGATVNEFIGRSIIGRLRNILSGKPAKEEIPTPWVCQVIPERIELIQVGGRLIFQDGILTLTGYNYAEANSPRAYVVDEAGNRVESIQLFPYRTSPYQIQLNLQDLDFSAIPPRSRIVFQWPNVPETSGVAILMPAVNPPVARFTFTPSGGSAPLTVQFTDTSTGDPSQWYWSFGDGATSNERNPTHTFMEARRYEVQLTVSNPLGSSTVSEVLVVGEQLTADFSFTPRQGDAPLIVEFTDRSSGNPTAWEWDFGDGERSTERNPIHVYSIPNPSGYSVTLRVSNAQGSAVKTNPDRIIVKEKLDADFTADPTSGRAPLTVSFRDTSKGSNITGWLWNFGDGSTSTERNPTHTFTDSNLYDVTLTVTNLEGQTNSEVKRAYINAYQIVFLRPGFIIIPIFSVLNDLQAYTPSFPLARGGDQLDTGISYDRYVCGIIGMTAADGDIQESGAGDILKAYLFRQYSPAIGKDSWWLTADFRTHSDRKERWNINLLCLDRKTENIAFIYREFPELEGGKEHLTGLKTTDYHFCGIVGQAALYGDIQENDVQPVIWQAYLDTTNATDGEWKIVVDFATHNQNERWKVNVLCLKRGAYLATEKPAFLTQHYDYFAPPEARYRTSISVNDYHCGVVGISATWGDIQENDRQPILLQADMVPDGSIWAIRSYFAWHRKAPDWRVDTLCVNKEYVKGEIPPP